MLDTTTRSAVATWKRSSKSISKGRRFEPPRMAAHDLESPNRLAARLRCRLLRPFNAAPTLPSCPCALPWASPVTAVIDLSLQRSDRSQAAARSLGQSASCMNDCLRRQRARCAPRTIGSTACWPEFGAAHARRRTRELDAITRRIQRTYVQAFSVELRRHTGISFAQPGLALDSLRGSIL